MQWIALGLACFVPRRSEGKRTCGVQRSAWVMTVYDPRVACGFTTAMHAWRRTNVREPTWRSRRGIGTGHHHFVIAVWNAKEAESRVNENDNSFIKTFDQSRAFPARFAAHSSRNRLLCAFAASASRMSRWLRRLKHIPRRGCAS